MDKILKNIGQSLNPSSGVLTKEKPNTTYQNFGNFNLPKLEVSLTGQKMVDLSMVIQALKDLYTKSEIALHVEAVHYNFILEEGVLQIPIKLKIENQHYCLFLIYSDKCAAAFIDARNRLQTFKKYRSVYLSKIPMTGDRAPQSGLTTLRFDHFRIGAQNPVLENYAVWWSTSKEPIFKGSKSFKDLTEISKTLNGYESYFIGRFFKELEIPGFIREEVKRVALPKKERTLTIIGPEEQTILISFSQKKGIRLHFDRFATPFGYRAAIIEQLCIAIQAYIIKLQLRDLPRDATTNSGDYNWFEEVNEEEVIGLLDL